MSVKNISAKTALSLDMACYLITGDTQELCYCAELPIQQSEFYRAGMEGIKAEKCLAVDSEGYEGQKRVMYENKRYAVYRFYPRDDGLTELYLEYKVGG